MANSDFDEIHSNKEHPVTLDGPAADILTNNPLTIGGLVIEDGVQIVTSVNPNGLCINGQKTKTHMCSLIHTSTESVVLIAYIGQFA